MFESTILDVVIGLIFTFLAVSLAASSAVEALSSALKWRSMTLLQGMKEILNDPGFTGLAKVLYGHALVNPLEKPGADPTDRSRKPAYIDPKQFADALMQSVGMVQNTPEAAKAAIDASPLLDDQLKTLLNGIVARTNNQVVLVRNEIAAWFDRSMDRVSGFYKRRTQLWLFLVALGMALVLNIDTIQISTVLWRQPMVTRSVSAEMGKDLDSAMAEIGKMSLPVGWTEAKFSELTKLDAASVWPILGAILGWLLTAFATLFGAPFWFDALQKIVRLKGTGPSPEEKKGAAGAD